MGFFDRLGNMITGFLNLFIGKVEEQNPAAVYEAAIQERLKQHAKLKKAISNIVFLRNKTQDELDRIQVELQQTNEELEGAMALNEDELAVLLIERQETLLSDLTIKEKELEKISGQAEESKEQLRIFQGEIEKLKREKEEKLAQLENAKARVQIQEQLDGLSLDADIQALNNVRDSISKKVAEADVGAELAESGLDVKLKQMRASGKNLRAQQKLEEMKKQRSGKTQTEGSSAAQQRLEEMKKQRAAQTESSADVQVRNDKTI